MRRLHWVVLIVLVTGLCGRALAEEAAPAGKKGKAKVDKAERGAAMFKAADADGNGSLSLAEFKAMHEKRLEKIKQRLGDKYDAAKAAKRPTAEVQFAKLDADKNGSVTKEEMAAAHKNARKNRGEAKGAGKGKKAKATPPAVETIDDEETIGDEE